MSIHQGVVPQQSADKRLSQTHSRLLDSEGPSKTRSYSLTTSHHTLLAICYEDSVAFVFSTYILHLQARMESVFHTY